MKTGVAIFLALFGLLMGNPLFGIPDELPELKQPEPKVDIIQEEPKLKEVKGVKRVKIKQSRPFKAREFADWKITAYCPCKAHNHSGADSHPKGRKEPCVFNAKK